MKIQDFIKGYEVAKDKESYMSEHIKTHYIDFEEKVAIGNVIAKTFSRPNGDFIRNAPAVYMNYIFTLVKEYTDIEVEKSSILFVFNAIEKDNITPVLMSAIGADASRMETVIKMVINDAIDNHNDLVNFMSLKSDNVNIILDKFKDALSALPQK